MEEREPGKERLEVKEDSTKDSLLSSRSQSSPLYILVYEMSFDEDEKIREPNSISIFCFSSAGGSLARTLLIPLSLSMERTLGGASERNSDKFSTFLNMSIDDRYTNSLHRLMLLNLRHRVSSDGVSTPLPILRTSCN